MSRFIAAASLRVAKQDTHTSTNIALQQIGCNLYGEYNEDSPYFYLHEGDYCVSPCRLDTVGRVDYIDCNHFANGDEDLAVKLFIALAELRDNTKLKQWFSHLSPIDNKTHYKKGEFWLGHSHRLTPLELAEAVMRGDIKL